MELFTLKTLFESNNRFEIPTYQRSYSWEENQLKQFIDDLKYVNGNYYLGHFLFEQSNNNFKIIDGQQRLTTCIIFFCSIKHELLQRDEDHEILSTIDSFIRDNETKAIRFKTVKYDNPFFENEVINRKPYSNDSTTSSQQRIRNAKIFFDKILRNTTTENIIEWFNLVVNSRITKYVVTDKIQAAQIFAFQNDRGKPLSKLEILKSFFILQIYINSKYNELIEENVSYLEEEFKNIYSYAVKVKINEDDLLLYFWRSISQKGYNSENVIEEVKDIIKIESDKINWIKNFVTGIKNAFETVIKLENSNNSYVKNLFYLNNMALSYPFLIKAYAVNCREETISRLSHLLEVLTFRNLLRGGRAVIESRINDFLKTNTDDQTTTKNIDSMVYNIDNNGNWRYWSTSEMIRNLEFGWFYKNRVDNYLLWRYELSIASVDYQTPINVSFNELISNENIEHIAPQTPTDGNPIANGYGIYDDKENPENGIVSGEWLDCVGNLMLISKKHNCSIGNKPFKEKLKTYGKGNLLNQQKEIIDFVENKEEPIWDKCAIEKRRNRIVDAAIKIWSLDNI